MNQLRTIRIVILLAAISWIKCDICDICECTENECSGNRTESQCAFVADINEVFKCNGIDRENRPILDLNTIQWPMRNTTVAASFNQFKLTYLTNVLCRTSTLSHAPILLEINLDENSIEQIAGDPFQYCPNLKSISMTHNLIKRFPSEFLDSTHSLQRLNVSHNALSSFDGNILSRCKQIIQLDVSHNQITILKVNEILESSPKIETINAAYNLLFAISDNNRNKYSSLKSLNLSGNKMTVITSNTFPSYPSLEYLNVSSNLLANIEQTSFQKLDFLRVVDLSSNHLNDLSLQLPENIERISFAANKLKFWPMETFPKNMQSLELQDNQLTEMYNSALIGSHRVEFSNIKFLNISRNRISIMSPILSYPLLEIFDASFNEFTSIPQYLGAQAPALKVLSLRGNPIKTIEFTTRMSAHFIDLSELPKLSEFDANVFSSVESKDDCIELIISHNSALEKIKNSFIKVPKLCRLDLSYNRLKFIDHNWMNWSALDRGVDFQGNPIDCSCSSQWLLDFFVPMLYTNAAYQHYLYEMRCASPERFKGHRLVRYLNHTDAFCSSQLSTSQFAHYLNRYSEAEDEYELLWYRGFGLWLIVALTLIIIASSISIIFILARRYHRDRTIQRNNRRFHNGGVL